MNNTTHNTTGESIAKLELNHKPMINPCTGDLVKNNQCKE